METNPNISRLLAMLDNPEAYTEQEIYDIIHSDEETLKAYRCMVAAKQAYRHKQALQPADAEVAWRRFMNEMQHEESEGMKNEESPEHGTAEANSSSFIPHPSFKKIAASFIAVLLLTGAAFAAYHFLSPHRSVKPSEAVAPYAELTTADSLVRFTNARLDSILTVIAGHYGRKVCFRDSATRTMKFITTWNPEDPVAAFIDHLNMFDGLNLTLRDDTIFVESTKDEEGAQ